MEKSAGVICFKKDENNNILFFVVHPGGPFNKNKNKWGIPKGHIETNETPFIAALREFKEETNIILPNDYDFIDLGEKNQNPNKKIHIFAINWSDFDYTTCFSNECEIEWPYKSGNKIKIPEIDKYDWKSYNDLEKIGINGQLPFFKKIIDMINNEDLKI